MNLIKNILILAFEKIKHFSIFVVVGLQSLFLFSCKERNVSYENKLWVYGENFEAKNVIDFHKIYFTLPSKYHVLGDNKVPSIYSDHTIFSYAYREMRENIYIADTLKFNWFYYYPAFKLSDSIDVAEFTMESLSQLYCTECTGKVYDVIKEKSDNGNEKYVFISFCPSKIGQYGWTLKRENVGIDLHIDCLLKTKDDYCMTFSIRSFEPLADFNYQEKMDIINSIYVE